MKHLIWMVTLLFIAPSLAYADVTATVLGKWSYQVLYQQPSTPIMSGEEIIGWNMEDVYGYAPSVRDSFRTGAWNTAPCTWGSLIYGTIADGETVAIQMTCPDGTFANVAGDANLLAIGSTTYDMNAAISTGEFNVVSTKLKLTFGWSNGEVNTCIGTEAGGRTRQAIMDLVLTCISGL